MKDTLKSIKEHSVTILVIVCCMFYVNSCRTESKIANYTKRIETLETKLDIKVEMESIKMSKRMLQDMNYIIFTKSRPDSAIKSYDVQIESLQKKLNNF